LRLFGRYVRWLFLHPISNSGPGTKAPTFKVRLSDTHQPSRKIKIQRFLRDQRQSNLDTQSRQSTVRLYSSHISNLFPAGAILTLQQKCRQRPERSLRASKTDLPSLMSSRESTLSISTREYVDSRKMNIRDMRILTGFTAAWRYLQEASTTSNQGDQGIRYKVNGTHNLVDGRGVGIRRRGLII
jgi:hypothetical protein